MEFILQGRPLVPGHGLGKALVSLKPISFLGGIDPKTGKVIEKGHDLRGKNVRGTILCFPHGHGSTVGSYVLYSLARKGVAPSAMINTTADPVVVVGAVIADIPMVDSIDITKIKNEDTVEVNAGEGTLRVTRDD